jgi:hypothetical protein
MNDFNNAETPTNQASDTYDTNGYNSFEKTMTGWKLTVKFFRPTTAGIPSDPGQQLVEAARFQFGTSARIYVRWFDRNGYSNGNYSGYALIDWQQSKTSASDIEEVTVNFTGDGALTPISNPYAATAVPAVASVSPASQLTGKQVQIVGSNFTGTVATTGVTFGGTNASSWIVVSDSLIVAVLPSGSAGPAAVVVTNANGAGNSFAYTRGA